MEKIFLIYCSTTDWDIPSQLLGFTLTEDEAKTIIARETALYKKAVKLAEDINNRRNEFTKNRVIELESQLKIPKWASGVGASEITPEMHNERNDIIAKNLEITKRNYDKQVVEGKLIYNHLYDYFFSGNDNDDIKHSFDFNESYGGIVINNFLITDDEYFYVEVSQIK